MYKITEKVALNPTVTKMVIEAPLIAKKAKPGQFIIVFAPLCWLFLFLRTKTRLYALSGITDAALTGDKMKLSIIIVNKRESKSIFFVYVVANLNDDTGKARKSEVF